MLVAGRPLGLDQPYAEGRLRRALREFEEEYYGNFSISRAPRKVCDQKVEAKGILKSGSPCSWQLGEDRRPAVDQDGTDVTPPVPVDTLLCRPAEVYRARYRRVVAPGLIVLFLVLVNLILLLIGERNDGGRDVRIVGLGLTVALVAGGLARVWKLVVSDHYVRLQEFSLLYVVTSFLMQFMWSRAGRVYCLYELSCPTMSFGAFKRFVTRVCRVARRAAEFVSAPGTEVGPKPTKGRIVEVLRSNEWKRVSVLSLYVGDIIKLRVGDEVPMTCASLVLCRKCVDGLRDTGVVAAGNSSGGHARAVGGASGEIHDVAGCEESVRRALSAFFEGLGGGNSASERRGSNMAALQRDYAEEIASIKNAGPLLTGTVFKGDDIYHQSHYVESCFACRCSPYEKDSKETNDDPWNFIDRRWNVGKSGCFVVLEAPVVSFLREMGAVYSLLPAPCRDPYVYLRDSVWFALKRVVVAIVLLTIIAGVFTQALGRREGHIAGFVSGNTPEAGDASVTSFWRLTIMDQFTACVAIVAVMPVWFFEMIAENYMNARLLAMTLGLRFSGRVAEASGARFKVAQVMRKYRWRPRWPWSKKARSRSYSVSEQGEAIRCREVLAKEDDISALYGMKCPVQVEGGVPGAEAMQLDTASAWNLLWKSHVYPSRDRPLVHHLGSVTTVLCNEGTTVFGRGFMSVEQVVHCGAVRDGEDEWEAQRLVKPSTLRVQDRRGSADVPAFAYGAGERKVRETSIIDAMAVATKVQLLSGWPLLYACAYRLPEDRRQVARSVTTSVMADIGGDTGEYDDGSPVSKADHGEAEEGDDRDHSGDVAGVGDCSTLCIRQVPVELSSTRGLVEFLEGVEDQRFAMLTPQSVVHTVQCMRQVNFACPDNMVLNDSFDSQAGAALNSDESVSGGGSGGAKHGLTSRASTGGRDGMQTSSFKGSAPYLDVAPQLANGSVRSWSGDVC